MKKYILPVFLSALVLLDPVWAEPPQEADQIVLSLEQCLRLALENNPSIRSAESQARSTASRVDQHSAGLKPSVSASARHVERRGSYSTSSGISINQLISDGGRTLAAVAAARRNSDAAFMNLEKARMDVVYNVTSAYFGVLQARWDVIVAEETVALYNEQLMKARSAYDAGIVARSDVTAAEVDLGNARLGLVRSKADLERTFAVLENTMGARNLPDRYHLAEATPPLEVKIDLDTAMDQALKNRPDFAAELFGVQAAEATLRLQEKSMSPELSAYAGYDWSRSGPGNDDDWQVGLSLSIPLYDGGLSEAKIEEAKASLEKERSDLDSFRMAILLEVKTALLDLEEARENIDVSGLVTEQARENLDLASGRYRVGVGNALEVSQAAENYSQAQKNHNQALYQYHLALAALQASMGRDLLPWTKDPSLATGAPSGEVF